MDIHYKPQPHPPNGLRYHSLSTFHFPIAGPLVKVFTLHKRINNKKLLRFLIAPLPTKQ